MTDPSPIRPGTGRDETDESLRAEREKTDRELEHRRAAAEAGADEVVRIARTRAADVLSAARERADDKLRGDPPSAKAQEILDGKRERADEALGRERAVAERALLAEREERRSALAEILRLDRGETDGRLLLERARSDEVVRTRDDFLAMVAHDLRALLGGVALHASTLLKGAGDDEVGQKVARSAAGIRRFTARMAILVNDLVDVIGIEAGQLAVSPGEGDAGALVQETLSTFQATASTRGIELRAEASAAPLPARFDQERMLQVLANLVGNAMKFTPRGGHIEVRAKAADEGVHLSVVDSGVGIAPDLLETVFQRFWRASTHDRSGLGLGLFISKSIVEAHGGRIWAESDGAHGSTLHFTIPR